MAAWAVAAAFVATLLGCGLFLRLARRVGLFDVPNTRSAHRQPTPRGGGVGILAGMLAALAVLTLWEYPVPPPYPGLLVIALALLLAGLLDDRAELPVMLRLPLYAILCLAAVWLLRAGLPLWLGLLAALYALWILNLFNFMDGIDGIAASEAGFVFAAAAGLSLSLGVDGFYPLLCLLLAAGCLAFLHWNWAPARLFMGDAGSIPLGFLLAMLSLQGEVSGEVPLSCWLILLAVFITDSTYTLFWRALHGEKVTEAHSRHSYQRLARHWDSHGRVVVVMSLYNLFWLLPLAFLAAHRPGLTWPCLLLAYLPLLPLRRKADKLP